MSTTIIQEMEDSKTAYNDFNNNILEPDKNNLHAKIAAWKNLHVSAEMAMILFCLTIMDAGGPLDNTIQSKTGLKADGSSITKNKENEINVTGKMMNYLTAYQNTNSAVQGLWSDAANKNDANAMTDIDKYLNAMIEYFDKGIFGGSSGDIIKQAKADIDSVFDQIGPKGSGKPFTSLHDIWVQMQKGPGGNDSSEAGQLSQTMTNAINNIFASVKTNTSAVGAQLQSTEGDYKSFLAVISKIMQALNQIITQSEKRQNT